MKSIALWICLIGSLTSAWASETITLNPTDDTYVRGAEYADGNFNDETTLLVKNGSGETYDRHAYLRFDLSGVTQDISAATLKLRVKHLANGTPASAYLYSVNDDGWQEDTLTWNTAPVGDILLDSHSDISYTETVYSFDLSSFVRSELHGDKTVTVMLQDDDAVNMEVRFYNRESEYQPELVLEVASTPAVPVASFSYTVSDPDHPLSVNFIDSSENLPTLWQWRFGDSQSSEEQHPQHTYAQEGNYTVTLTVENSMGTHQTQKQIEITPRTLSDHDYYAGDYSSVGILGMDLPSTWRPFSLDSAWNSPIPTGVTVHSDSEAIIAYAAQEATNGNLRFAGYYNPSLWVVNSENIPLVTDATASYPFDTWDPDFDAAKTVDVGIPVTETMWPENTEDGHIIIIDPFKKLAWEMSRYSWANYQSGGNLSSTFNMWDLTGSGQGDGREGYRRPGARGGRGSGFPIIAGLIRPEEVAAGEIRHALVFTFENNREYLHIPPAARTDGQFSGTQYPIEGMRFQLNPNLTEADFDSWGLSEYGKILARCLQQYGMYNGDNGGSMALQIQAIDPNDNQGAWDQRFPGFYDAIKKIPVNQFRVIDTGEAIDREAPEIYNTRVVAPLIRPVGKTFEQNQTVEILSATEETAIVYTTDGTAPTHSSTPYTEPFTIDRSMTIKAMVYKEGMIDSPVTRAPFIKSGEKLTHQVPLQRDGWNLMAVCQDRNASEIDMHTIEQIQAQDGRTLYSGADANLSTLEMLEAGYGYWVKGQAGTVFDVGVAAAELQKPLTREGWNLMASCEERSRDMIDMTDIEEIQAQNGESIYTGEWGEYSNLDRLLNGYGYWVKGNEGVGFYVNR